jgi:hypothetical protein
MFGLFLVPTGVVAATCMPTRERLPTRLSFEEQSAQTEEARAKESLAQMQPKPPSVAHQARRLLGEVEERKHRWPKVDE